MTFLEPEVCYSTGVLTTQYGFDLNFLDDDHCVATKVGVPVVYYLVKQHPTWLWILDPTKHLCGEAR